MKMMFPSWEHQKMVQSIGERVCKHPVFEDLLTNVCSGGMI